MSLAPFFSLKSLTVQTNIESIGHSFKTFDLEFATYVDAMNVAEKDIERLSTITTQKGVQGGC